MPTLEEVLRYEIAMGAKRIREIKDVARKTEKRKSWGWFLDEPENLPELAAKGFFNGIKGLLGRLVSKDIPADKVRWREYEQDVVVSHISPRHGLWPEYVAQKMHVSVALAALRICRGSEDLVHCPSRKHKEFSTGGAWGLAAHRKIQRITKALGKGSYAEVDEWIKEIMAKREARPAAEYEQALLSLLELVKRGEEDSAESENLRGKMDDLWRLLSDQTQERLRLLSTDILAADRKTCTKTT